MMEKVATWMMVWAVVIGVAAGYSTGDVGFQCDTMIPGHGNLSTTGMPYNLTVDSTNEAGVYKVGIVGSDNYMIRGFMLRSRDQNGNKVGTFSEDTTPAKVHDQNCVSHSEGTDKYSISVRWDAGSFTGVVEFRATVVQRYEVYWMLERDFSIQ